jgi:hypothetical protein
MPPHEPPPARAHPYRCPTRGRSDPARRRGCVGEAAPPVRGQQARHAQPSSSSRCWGPRDGCRRCQCRCWCRSLVICCRRYCCLLALAPAQRRQPTVLRTSAEAASIEAVGGWLLQSGAPSCAASSSRRPLLAVPQPARASGAWLAATPCSLGSQPKWDCGRRICMIQDRIEKSLLFWVWVGVH